MRRTLSPDLIELAVKEYSRLKSGNAVAKRLGVSHSSAYRLLNAGGVELPDRFAPEIQERKKKLHGDAKRLAGADYLAGASRKEMCEKYGVGWYSIKTAVKDLKLSERDRGGKYRRLSDEQKCEAIRLYQEEYLSQVQVAAKIGCSQIIVSRILKKAGIATRGGRPSMHRHSAYKGGRRLTAVGMSKSLLQEMIQ